MSKKYEIFLFDLDGTITDSALGITNSVMYALKKFGIEETDRTKLYKFIGPPLTESFEKFYGFTKEQSLDGVKYYREYYHDKGIYENRVYDGLEEVLKKAEEIQAAQKAAAGGVQYPQVEEKPEITIDDFDKIQIRVGEVLKCEPVPKAKKLLVSQIRIGDEVRQIVSGIAKYYKPEEMVGKKVMVVTNLKPAKLAGILSEGMILCAEDADGNLSLMVPEKEMPAGAEIC